MTITYVTDGNLQDLELQGVGTIPEDEPVIYWAPDIFVEPVPGKDTGILSTLFATGLLLANLLGVPNDIPPSIRTLVRPFELYAEPKKMAMGGSPSKPLGGSTIETNRRAIMSFT